MTFDFRVTPRLLGQGLLWAVLIGAAGGLFPAIRAARLPVTAAAAHDVAVVALVAATHAFVGEQQVPRMGGAPRRPVSVDLNDPRRFSRFFPTCGNGVFPRPE